MLADYEDSGINTKQVLDDLSVVERDLHLRRLLWESSDEWGKLLADWTITRFDELNVDIMQKNVSKFTQTVFMLEKGHFIFHRKTYCKLKITLLQRLKANILILPLPS